MWHASIAYWNLNRSRLVPIERWDNRIKSIASGMAADLLQGVGVEPSRKETRLASYHLRRSLSELEIAGLDRSFATSPAIDHASDGKAVLVDW